MVRKKDGSLRFAIDYRQLNEHTRNNAYAKPDPQSLFDALEGSKIFSILDGASAYWCVKLKKEDVEKPAFTVPRGHYEMLVMPFGLCNSKSTFQRILDVALNEAKNTDSYVDNCITHSLDFQIHLVDLRKALEFFKAANIQLRRDKCRFGYNSGVFLGHDISEDGRRPVGEMVERIVSFPTPTKLRNCKGLWELEIIRQYIPDLSTIAKPLLHMLMRKSSIWEWDAKCQEAFQMLCRRLPHQPVVLAHPKWDSPFFVEADASSVEVAAVLSQKDPHTCILRPISYFSTTLNESQRRYSAGQREAWALFSATRKWYDSEVGFTCNTLVNASTGLCPHELMYGNS